MSEIKPCPEITQADRDATAKVLGYQCWADATDYRLTGQQDRQVEKFVQAFARHRSDACATVQRERDELREMLANLINIIDGTDHDENGCAVLRLDWWEVVNARAFLARYEGEVK